MVVDRILTLAGVRKPRDPSSVKMQESEDCFECRMVGGGGLTALGTSVLYFAYQKRDVQKRFATLASACVGSCILAIGALRLLGVHMLAPPAPKQNLQNK